MRRISGLIGGGMAVVVLFFGIAACTRPGDEGGEREVANQLKLQQQAKISASDAQAAAVVKAPGAVTGVRLTKENGKAIWDVTVQPQGGGQMQEVQVDATSGQVLGTGPARLDGEEGGDGD